MDDLRLGVLLRFGLWRSDVHAKLGIDMGDSGEPGTSRLSKEKCIGPGGKPSSQKLPCQVVAGSHL